MTKADVKGEFRRRDDSNTCDVTKYIRIYFTGPEVFKNSAHKGLTISCCVLTLVLIMCFFISQKGIIYLLRLLHRLGLYID
jgi:hypothetical protein